jgi:hypothetical protein
LGVMNGMFFPKKKNGIFRTRSLLLLVIGHVLAMYSCSIQHMD